MYVVYLEACSSIEVKQQGVVSVWISGSRLNFGGRFVSPRRLGQLLAIDCSEVTPMLTFFWRGTGGSWDLDTHKISSPVMVE